MSESNEYSRGWRSETRGDSCYKEGGWECDTQASGSTQWQQKIRCFPFTSETKRASMSNAGAQHYQHYPGVRGRMRSLQPAQQQPRQHREEGGADSERTDPTRFRTTDGARSVTLSLWETRPGPFTHRPTRALPGLRAQGAGQGWGDSSARWTQLRRQFRNVRVSRFPGAPLCEDNGRHRLRTMPTPTELGQDRLLCPRFQTGPSFSNATVRGASPSPHLTCK